MIGAKIDVRTGWGAEFAKEVNERVRVAVTEASEHGADVASDIAQRRRRTGRMAKINAVSTRGTPTGWEGGFKSEAFYSGFQSRGTNAARKRVSAATLRRRQSASGQARQARVAGAAGVKPLHHEEAGLKAAKKRLRELLNRI